VRKEKGGSMGALFTVSYWIILVTVIPGMVTIAAIYGAFAFIDPALLEPSSLAFAGFDNWFGIAIAVTIMILTQTIGILLEEVLVRRKWLGRKKIAPQGIDCYEEYSQLYFYLAGMTKDDDAHGHHRRAVAQFFLTLNTLVSFLLGIIVALVIALAESSRGGIVFRSAGIYIGLMVGCFIVSYAVTRLRFREMARTIWATRQIENEPEVAGK
jgi:uncharacterized membrane protein